MLCDKQIWLMPTRLFISALVFKGYKIDISMFYLKTLSPMKSKSTFPNPQHENHSQR